MTRMTGLIVLALSVFSVPAFACEPAPNYGVAITSSDAPSCLTISPAWDYSTYSILLNNECEQVVVVEPRDCVECDGPTEVGVGEQKQLAVETTRDVNETRVVSWLSGDDSGSIATELSYRDNSGACDDWDDDPVIGCQQAGSGNILFAFFLILGWIGTGRLLLSQDA